MKWLKRNDFKRINISSDKYYYSYKNSSKEICLEPCLNGFDVAMYNIHLKLIEPKICTNLHQYMSDFINERDSDPEEAFLEAIKIANRLLHNTY